jgi:hypothetical protein
MNAQFSFLGYVLLQSIVISVVVLVLYHIVKRVFSLDPFLTYCATIILLGLLGYVTFWIAYINYTAFGFLKITALCTFVIWALFLAYRSQIGAYLHYLAEPLLYTFSVLSGHHHPGLFQRPT